MAGKIVDVFLGDRLVRSYNLAWGLANVPTFEQDFIDRARRRLQEDGVSDTEIADARFIVRDVPDQA